MVVSGYRILSACNRLEMTVSHDENKLTPRDSIQHAFSAFFTSSVRSILQRKFLILLLQSMAAMVVMMMTAAAAATSTTKIMETASRLQEVLHV